MAVVVEDGCGLRTYPLFPPAAIVTGPEGYAQGSQFWVVCFLDHLGGNRKIYITAAEADFTAVRAARG